MMSSDWGKFGSALAQLWPKGNTVVPGLLAGIIAAAPTVFPKYGADDPIVVCQFMAEASEECTAGTEMQENMNFNAARLLQVFPTHFTTAQAIAMQHNPRLIADQAYGGRMGNRIGTDDGYDFRGQGLTQVTGRNNVAALATKTGLDLLNHPELLADPAHALEIGLADFVIMCGCLPYAVKDDLVGVASMLNMGQYSTNTARINGFSMRRNWLTLWKHAMGVA
jgi:putative chitinase